MYKDDDVISDYDVVYIPNKKWQAKKLKEIEIQREIADNKLKEWVMWFYLDWCFFVEKTGNAIKGKEAYMDYHSLDYETFSKKWKLGNIWDKYKIVL